MNPNWNQQPYNWNQHTPGPPPPPWQSDPNSHTGWGDQRPYDVQQPSHDTPLSSYIPGPLDYPPHQYSSFPPPPPPPPIRHPPPPSSGAPEGPSSQPYNVAAWGVKYNQALNQNPAPPLQSPYGERRPALPPRPNSALPQTAQVPFIDHTWQRPTSPSQYPPSDPWNLPPAQGPPEHPPVPPPRPQEYTTYMQTQQGSLPHPQYSHQPLTHHYEPQAENSHWPPTDQHQHQPSVSITQPYISSHSGWGQTPHTTDGTVSPLEDEARRNSFTDRNHTISPVPNQNYHNPHALQNVQTVYPQPVIHVGSQALGPGQPSDWQHYHSFDPHDDDDGKAPFEQTSTDVGNTHHQFVSSPNRVHSESIVGPTETRPPQDHTEHFDSESPLHAAHFDAPDHSQSPSIAASHAQRPSPQRTGSSSTASSISGPQRTGTIDSVIHAWNAPLKRKPTAQDLLSHRSGSASSFGPNNAGSKVITKQYLSCDSQSQTDFPPMTTTEVKTVIKEVERNPYGDISDHYKATLKRFADMLRQEFTANNDQEKFKIFQGFVIHELRLRSVLYDIEPQHIDSVPSPGRGAQPPRNQDITQPEVGSQTPTEVVNVPHSMHAQDPPAKPVLLTRETPRSTLKNDSFVVVDDEKDLEHPAYSPGGRPRVSHKASPPRIATVKPSSTDIGDQNNRVAPLLSPGANAPITLTDYEMVDQHSPSDDAPMVVNYENISDAHHPSPIFSATLNGPISFQPPRPVYTPFRYNESTTHSPPGAKNDRPNEDYGAHRQAHAAESGRILINDLPPISPAGTTGKDHVNQIPTRRREHEEAFIGLIRQQSKVVRKPTPALENPLQLRAGTPLARNVGMPVANVSPLTKSVQTLRFSLPTVTVIEVTNPIHPKLDFIKKSLTAIKDDFSFIHATVLAWDMTNRTIRQQLDKERAVRQSENEARVDELFHDNEIGYADIATLESDFKLDEAGKKYQEDKLELESFSHDVFEFVVDRMEDELGELSKLQVLVRDLLDLDSQSRGNRMRSIGEGRSDTAEKLLMVDVMNVMLQLFSKIEMRHLKIAEAHFELERRRKKLELSILYTNGDNEGMKAIEKEFSKAQIMQVLEEARKKDERANKLIDSFDRAVVRGLAENQAWTDDISPKLQLVRDLLFGSEENYPKEQSERDDLIYGVAGVKDLVAQAQSAIDALILDSQQLIKLSYAADQILNEADFGMYLANEKILDPDAGRLDKLKRDKSQEDEKLKEEYEARLGVVCRDPEEIVGLLGEIVGRIGTDKEHKARIERALDEAKRRNKEDEVQA